MAERENNQIREIAESACCNNQEMTTLELVQLLKDQKEYAVEVFGTVSDTLGKAHDDLTQAREDCKTLAEAVIAIYDKVMGDTQSTDPVLAIARKVIG